MKSLEKRVSSRGSNAVANLSSLLLGAGILLAPEKNHAQVIQAAVEWNEPDGQPSPLVTKGYKIVYHKGNGPETSIFIPKDGCTNGVGCRIFDLDPNSTYYFSSCAVCFNPASPGVLVPSNFTETISLVTGARNGPELSPPILEIDKCPFYACGEVNLTGSVHDESHIRSMSLLGDAKDPLIDYLGSGGPWKASFTLPREGTNRVIIEAQDLYTNTTQKVVTIVNLSPNDWLKYQAGYDPANPKDGPKIIAVDMSGFPSIVTLYGQVKANQVYLLERSVDLTNWQTISTFKSEKAEIQEIVDPAPAPNQGVYRLNLKAGGTNNSAYSYSLPRING